MKITNLDTIALRMNFDQPVMSAMGQAKYFTQVLVKVETDEGITGYGETWTNYPSWAYLERQATINEGLKPLLEGCLLMVDANQGWTVGQACGMLSFLEEQNVFWLEEPVASREFGSMAGIKERAGINIACGENYYGRDFADALKADACDILQPDVTKCGGITEMVRISNMARIWSKKWVPHFFGGGVGLAATLQVMGCVPEGLLLEYPHDDGGIRNGILSTKLEVVDGCVEIPSLPGLGIVLDHEAVKHYRVL